MENDNTLANKGVSPNTFFSDFLRPIFENTDLAELDDFYIKNVKITNEDKQFALMYKRTFLKDGGEEYNDPLPLKKEDETERQFLDRWGAHIINMKMKERYHKVNGNKNILTNKGLAHLTLEALKSIKALKSAIPETVEKEAELCMI